MVGRRSLGLNFRRAVAGLFHRPDQRREVRVRARHMRPFGCQVDRCVGDSGTASKNLLDAADAGGTGHAGDGEVDRFDGFDGGVHLEDKGMHTRGGQGCPGRNCSMEMLP